MHKVLGLMSRVTLNERAQYLLSEPRKHAR